MSNSLLTRAELRREASAIPSTERRHRGGHVFASWTAEDFWSRVEKTETCWIWTGRRDEHGYGRIGFSRRARPRKNLSTLMRTPRIADCGTPRSPKRWARKLGGEK